MTETATKKPVLGKMFAEKVISVMLRSPQHCIQVASLCDRDYFSTADLGDVLCDIADACIEYINKYRSPPTKFVIAEECGEDVVKSVVYKKLYRFPLRDAKFVTENLAKWCQKQSARRVMLKFTSLPERDQNEALGQLVEDMREAVNLGRERSDPGMRLRDFAKRRAIYQANPRLLRVMPTGWPSIDHIMGGGLGAGELGVFLGVSGGGKSFGLLNAACAAMALPAAWSRDNRGAKVFFATLELSAAKTYRRFDKLLAGSQYFHLLDKGMPNRFMKQVRRQVDRVIHPESDLIVKQWPNETLKPSELNAELDMLAAQGWEPDLICVDYLDEMRPEKPLKELRFELKSIASALRAMAIQRNCAVWTASQASKEAIGKEIISVKHMAEDMGKVRVADVIISLCGTEEEREEGRMRLFLAKMRDAKSHVIIDTKFDFAHGKIEEIGIREKVKVVKSDSDDKVNRNISKYKKKRGNKEIEIDTDV